MINLDDSHLLYIEPKNPPSKEPLHDIVIFKYETIIESWDATDPTSKYRGVHICSCGAKSSNSDHVLRNNMHYNSLGLHYLLYHRKEVPDSELEKINILYDIIIEKNKNSYLEMLPKTPLYDRRKSKEEFIQEYEDAIGEWAAARAKEIDKDILEDLRKIL